MLIGQDTGNRKQQVEHPMGVAVVVTMAETARDKPGIEMGMEEL